MWRGMNNNYIDLNGLTIEQAFLLGTLCKGFAEGGPDSLKALAGIEIDLSRFKLISNGERIRLSESNSIRFCDDGIASIK